ncbi:hypothetical protein [Vibrio marisflavi]|uniref:Uncharacterized protein n=1 Tax=Vibrio marisflavi CECT 7928 TaxID=634439 RepID=A0ABN8EBM3_9VIBR|nr:hypothetical protein [Vibrio marisflavi]CAH0543290.1 hypothetical protein VMF7928_04506 [Vibrio marisflavi CECT 7928]
MVKLNKSSIPQWAKDILCAKGLGFDSKEVQETVWHYFVDQFSCMDISISELGLYFGHLIDEELKKGNIKKAREMFNSQSISSHRKKNQTVKLSALTEFTEKYTNYLEEDVQEGTQEEHPIALDLNQIEYQLLYEAYTALESDDESQKLKIIEKLRKFFEQVGRPQQ